jgi:hypothetical protein
MVPAGPYTQQGWSKRLNVGDVLTCAGTSMSFGDGVPLVKFSHLNGEPLGVNDCEFRPSIGGMWNLKPNRDYLELVNE